MEEKVIFEIPIYPYSENEFKKRWRPDNEWAREIAQREYKSTGRYYPSLFWPKNTWKYNQIIGYIVISVDIRNVNF